MGLFLAVFIWTIGWFCCKDLATELRVFGPHSIRIYWFQHVSTPCSTPIEGNRLPEPTRTITVSINNKAFLHYLAVNLFIYYYFFFHVCALYKCTKTMILKDLIQYKLELDDTGKNVNSIGCTLSFCP